MAATMTDVAARPHSRPSDPNASLSRDWCEEKKGAGVCGRPKRARDHVPVGQRFTGYVHVKLLFFNAVAWPGSSVSSGRAREMQSGCLTSDIEGRR